MGRGRPRSAAAGSKTDKEHGCPLPRAGDAERHRPARHLSRYFLHQQRDKVRDKIVTAAIQKTIRACASGSTEERDRVWALVQRKRAVEARDRSIALFTIAHAVIERFRAEKDRRGLLDYEDLIDKTLDLLNNVSAAWVHYKLDRGIHHVLIDEAQDTSPKQWEIVKALVGEFFAGAGAHDRAAHDLRGRRREAVDLLVPGRGAARIRGDARRISTACTSSAQLDFVSTEFKHSFRSGENVLGAVDTVFCRRRRTRA